MKKIYLGKSKIQGDGIFAGEDIKKGEFVVFLKGKEIRRAYNHKKDEKKCANWFGIKKNIWIDPFFPLSHINHSCNPNLGIAGTITFRALCNINKDEELTFDYSIDEEELDWLIKCKCGEKNCRKTIRSIQFLPKKIFNRYLPYIPIYFQKVYCKHNKLQN